MSCFVHPWKLQQAVQRMQHGGVIAYPTEAIYGLGCDPVNPDAVYRLLAMKQRAVEKGLILVAASIEQLLPYMQPLSAEQLQRLQQSWPGPNTWVVPARPEVPAWIRGQHDTLAVRVSAHPVVQALCQHFAGPIISTSANRAGQPPAHNALQVRLRLVDQPDMILHAPLGGADKPTEIRDLITGKILRAA